MVKALSASMAIHAVANASALIQSGAMTVADNVGVINGYPVIGDMVWPTRRPSGSVRKLR